ncbi:MAG: tetratricopeptide repeat protein [Flavobacteriales bacterium]|nr:tetratricopeptide repeat protein [Flavobacteriales bacterium]
MFKTALSILICTFVSLSVIGQDVQQLRDEASVFFAKGNLKSALKSIDKALKIDTTDCELFRIKAFYLDENNQSREAYDLLTKTISKFPKVSGLFLDRGNIFLAWDDYNGAASDFGKAFEYAENDTMRRLAIMNRGVAKLRRRQFESAYEDLMTAYKYDTNDLATLINLGGICDEIGRGDETLTYLLKAVQVDSTNPGPYVNIGFKYQHMGEYEKSIPYFDKALKLNPNEPLSYSNRSYSKLKSGDLKGAMQDIEKSLKLYPNNSWAYKNRGLIFLEQGEKDKACADFRTSLNLGFTTNYGPEVEQLIEEHCEN